MRKEINFNHETVNTSSFGYGVTEILGKVGRKYYTIRVITNAVNYRIEIAEGKEYRIGRLLGWLFYDGKNNVTINREYIENFQKVYEAISLLRLYGHREKI